MILFWQRDIIISLFQHNFRKHYTNSFLEMSRLWIHCIGPKKKNLRDIRSEINSWTKKLHLKQNCWLIWNSGNGILTKLINKINENPTKITLQHFEKNNYLKLQTINYIPNAVSASAIISLAIKKTAYNLKFIFRLRHSDNDQWFDVQCYLYLHARKMMRLLGLQLNHVYPNESNNVKIIEFFFGIPKQVLFLYWF